jgi:hypothetical protein
VFTGTILTAGVMLHVWPALQATPFVTVKQPSAPFTQLACVAAPAVGQKSPATGIAPHAGSSLHSQSPEARLQTWFVEQVGCGCQLVQPFASATQS